VARQYGRLRSMSSDSNTSSPIAEGDGSGNPYAAWESVVAKVKWVFVTVALVSPFASAFFFDFLSPAVSIVLLFIALFCWIFLILSLAVSLFRRRWKTVAIFAAVWTLVSLPLFGVKEPYIWLRIQGLRIHIAPIENYLTSCRLYNFVENETKQTVGACETTSYGPIEQTVFYDTSRQFELPASQRTSGWKQAMSNFSDSHILIDGHKRAVHLFGDFYQISINTEDEFDR
jgi:hypothetical protein